MKFSVSSSSLALLFSTVALCSPIASQNRSILSRRGKPAILFKDATLSKETKGSALSHFMSGSYTSSNWAGAVLTSSGGGYSSVTGKFVVPTVRFPSGADQSQSYCGSAWVGLDGTSPCNGGLLQTGVSWCINPDGSTTYTPWYEWYPAQPQENFAIAVSAGDEIKATVTAFSGNSGVAIIENLTSGEQQIFLYTGDNTQSPAICQMTAEWIVEDFTIGNNLASFADFGTVTWTGAYASHNGQAVDTNDAKTYVLVGNGGKALVDVSYYGNTVTISYK